MGVEILDIEAEGYYERWSTGFRMLDCMIGGGLGRGVVEVAGKESCGKSMLCYQIMGNCLRKGGAAQLYDQEDAFIPDRAEQLMRVRLADVMARQQDGKLDAVNSRFIPSRAESLEDLLEDTSVQSKLWRTSDILPHNAHIIFCMDSLAGTETNAEVSRGYHDKEYASIPASLSRNLRKTISVAHRQRFTLLLINQVRDKIGVMFGKKTDTPGGNALKFYCMLRIEMTIIKTLPAGKLIRLRSIKNKMDEPMRTLVMPYTYRRGFDDFETARETLIRLKAGKRTSGAFQVRTDDGSWVNFPKVKKDYDKDSRNFIITHALKIYRQHDRLVDQKDSDE